MVSPGSHARRATCQPARPPRSVSSTTTRSTGSVFSSRGIWQLVGEAIGQCGHVSGCGFGGQDAGLAARGENGRQVLAQPLLLLTINHALRAGQHVGADATTD